MARPSGSRRSVRRRRRSPLVRLHLLLLVGKPEGGRELIEVAVEHLGETVQRQADAVASGADRS